MGKSRGSLIIYSPCQENTTIWDNRICMQIVTELPKYTSPFFFFLKIHYSHAAYGDYGEGPHPPSGNPAPALPAAKTLLHSLPPTPYPSS